MTVGPELEVSTAAARARLKPGQTVVVGRAEGAAIVVDRPAVSRHHLQLRFSDGAWWAEDLGSSYGTFVDTATVRRLQITGAVTLYLGDPTDQGSAVQLTPVRQPAPASPSGASRADGPGHTVLVDDSTLGGGFTVGRDPTNDLALDDLLISRQHAELRRLSDGSVTLVDLDSFNGTYVNGKRITQQAIGPNDVITLGGHRLQLRDSALEVRAESADLSLAAFGLSVVTNDGVVLTNDVSFALPTSSLMAVVGPSGAGKSTLLGAITGIRPASAGTVYVGGRDLYGEYADLSRRIGYVPQDDLVHPELTIRQSLEYAAELRFPPDVTKAERLARVDEVMAELALVERADVQIKRLSGGQRKRVSVALELLTSPALLFLDEPTSGLDPALERSLMELLRSLADAGRTIVVVTHSVESLHLCDRLLCLAPGGSTAFFGPPALAMAYFQREDYQEVFADLGSGDATRWKGRYESHPFSDQYVTSQLAPYEAIPSKEFSGSGRPRQGWFRQFSMLTRRYVRVLAADRVALALIIGGPFLLGLLQWWRLPKSTLELLPDGQFRVISQAPLVLFTLVMVITQLGIASGIREIVREQSVYRRERAVGLSLSAYIASKALVLSVITVGQAAVVVPIAVAGQGGPDDAVLLGWPMGELIAAVALAGIAAMALALLVSAAVNTTTAALTLLPTLLLFQVVMGSGGVFPDGNDKPILREIGYATSANWGFGATASTVRLNELQPLSAIARQIPEVDLTTLDQLAQIDLEDNRGEPLWSHNSTAWGQNMAALAVIALACIITSGLLLRRFDPL